MRLFFVTLNYYPYSGACSSLIKKITEELKNVDDLDIQVIAMKQTPDEHITKCGDITVHRIWWWTMITKERMQPWKQQFPLAYVVGTVNKAIAKLDRSVFKQDFLDQSAIRNIHRKLDELSVNENDIIIPVAGHYETVKAALDYAKTHMSKVVVYQVDPCSSNAGYSVATGKKRTAFEHKMCDQADAIITTPILLKEMQKNLPCEKREKITAMEFPNICVPYSNSYPKVQEKRVHYTCVFAGAVYHQARNPAYTFRLFSALKDKHIVLRMIGVQKKQVAEFIGDKVLPENIEFFGTVPLEKAQQYMADADILINIGNIMMNQVPSKIFEYISSGKPIVNICTSHECPTLPYLEKYPYVLNLFACDSDFNEQVRKLENFIAENAGKRVSLEYIMKTYESCTAQYCAKQMLDVIRRVM